MKITTLNYMTKQIKNDDIYRIAIVDYHKEHRIRMPDVKRTYINPDK